MLGHEYNFATRDEARAADLEKNKASREAKRMEYEASKKNMKKEDDVSVAFAPVLKVTLVPSRLPSVAINARKNKP